MGSWDVQFSATSQSSAVLDLGCEIIGTSECDSTLTNDYIKRAPSFWKRSAPYVYPVIYAEFNEYHIPTPPPSGFFRDICSIKKLRKEGEHSKIVFLLCIMNAIIN